MKNIKELLHVCVLLLAAYALAACQAMGEVGAVVAMTKVGDHVNEYVAEYCTADENERELLRARVAVATGQNKVSVECGDDENASKTGSRDTGT